MDASQIDLTNQNGRISESKQIEDRFAEHLAPRNASHSPFSADYLSRQPKNALEAAKVGPELQEEILYHWAVTNSMPKTMRLAGASLQQVRAVIFNPGSSEIVQASRDLLRVSVLNKIQETQVILLDAIQDETKLAKASIREIATVMTDVSEVGMALLNAQREAESGTFASSVDPAAVFSGEELEYFALMRRRIQAGPMKSTELAAGDPMSGHEMVDAGFSIDTTIDPGFEPTPDQNAATYDPFAEESE